MLTKVKEVLEAIGHLNGREQTDLLKKLPDVLKPSIGKRPLTEEEIVYIAKLSKQYRQKWTQGKTRTFHSWKEAVRWLDAL